MLGCAAWLRRNLWRRRDVQPAAIFESGSGVVRNVRSHGLGCRLVYCHQFGQRRERRHGVHRGPQGPTLTACAEVTDTREAPPTSNAVVAKAGITTAAEPVTPTAADTTAVPDRPELTVEAALPDSSQKPSQEAPPVQVATAAEPVPPAVADTRAVPDEPKSIVDAALPDSSQKPSQETLPVQVATATEPVTQAAADTKAVPDEPKSIVDAALPDASQSPPHEPAPVRLAMASTSDLAPNDVKDTKDAGTSLEMVDECLVPDVCIDRYLWALYQRTPKEDTNKVLDQKQVTVKRKGKMVTVTRSFTKLVDADFTWKDPKAAEKVMWSIDYVDPEAWTWLQGEALSYASRGGRGRAVAWHHQRVPR